ncbi:MAG: hypothetical protein M3525_04980 [Acidobacteriota bacterium]|nr:hypothetical protein [Acidobacteriota bacterium]
MNDFPEKMCPKCHYPKMKSWEELSGEEKFLIEKLPPSAEFSPAERKKHRFCERCRFEAVEPRTEIV